MSFTPSTIYCPVRHSPLFAIPQLSPICVTYVRAKGFLDSNFNQEVIDEISVFHEMAQKFHK